LKLGANPGAGGFRFRTVATGGTFDHVHAGHRALLEKSFEVGYRVIIGLTSDEFVSRVGKKPDFDYPTRERKLREYIEKSFPGREYQIAKLYDYFGPGIADGDVQALVASPETGARLELANKLRSEKGFPPLELVTVGWVEAADGKPISSTRIRKGEVDEEGRVLGGDVSSDHPGK
jgi:cytidyltransferase-like protein